MISRKLIGATALAASVTLSPLSALAHTNAVGYSGDGSGNVTFWYGNWHSNTGSNGVTTEGEIKLEGVNGNTYTTTIVDFDTFVIYDPAADNTPDGLVSGTNLFQSDGTTLVPVGDPGVNNSTVYTWQGATFSGLEAGDYQFTYIPVGDPESSDPTGTATMDWTPQDEVIRSSEFTLTAEVIGTPVEPVAPPTVTNVTRASVGSQSSTQVSYTPTESDGKQTVRAGYRTTTIDNTKVTTTYSDGSEVVAYESNVSIEETSEVFSGRIDQVETLDEMTAGLYQTLNRTPETEGARIRFFGNGILGWSDTQTGYHGTSTVYGGGVEYDVTDNWVVGVQVNQINTEFSDGGDSSTKDGTHLGVVSLVHEDYWSIRSNAGYVWNEYSVDRSVGPFSNNFNTSGTEWWINNRAYWHPNGNGINGNGISPFIGHTVQNTTVNGYSESGSDVTGRDVGGTSTTTHSGEVGVLVATRFGGDNDDLVGLGLEASVDTDQRFNTVASLDFDETIVFEGFYQVDNNTTNAGVSANVQFTF
tara:strand:- start:5019 stop:6605 length:1587 start_codon:yes stop_codon:yes gene_type:complete